MRLAALGLALLVAGGCRQSMSSPVKEAKRDATRAWEELLGRIVIDGRVDYDTLTAEREALDAYVAWLGSEDAWQGRMTKDWHAQYLNAYNALVLFQVLERGRPASVLDVKGWIPKPGSGFFVETQFPLGVEWLSLSEIEHERLRWKEMDYRDHAAMNCASQSCPPLRAELYRPKDLQAQLDEQMAAWVADDARGLRFEGDEVVFSPIFDWFARDFEFFSAGQSLCEIAAEHAVGKRRVRLTELQAKGCPHRFFAYDWALNDASAPE